MFSMDTFSDAYTPMPAFQDWFNGSGIFAGARIGSASISLAPSAQSLAYYINQLNPGAGWSYGEATAAMIQARDPGATCDLYAYAGGVAFNIEDAYIGSASKGFPFWVARNRSQLENLQLADPTGAGAIIQIHFYIGNGNVTP